MSELDLIRYSSHRYYYYYSRSAAERAERVERNAMQCRNVEKETGHIKDKIGTIANSINAVKI